MIIRFSDGQVVEAALLSRTERTIRAALRGSDDAVELTQINDVWVTDNCDPVQVEFAWDAPGPQGEVKEEDCICPPELAAELIRMLEGAPEEPAASPPVLPAPDRGKKTRTTYLH